MLAIPVLYVPVPYHRRAPRCDPHPWLGWEDAQGRLWVRRAHGGPWPWKLWGHRKPAPFQALDDTPAREMGRCMLPGAVPTAFLSPFPPGAFATRDAFGWGLGTGVGPASAFQGCADLAPDTPVLPVFLRKAGFGSVHDKLAVLGRVAEDLALGARGWLDTQALRAVA